MSSGAEILYPMPDNEAERRGLRETLTLHNSIMFRYRRKYHIDILTALGIGVTLAVALLIWVA